MSSSEPRLQYAPLLTASFPGVYAPPSHRQLHVAHVASHPDSIISPLYPASLQHHVSAGPLFTLAVDLRPALDEVALASRKRKRGSSNGMCSRRSNHPDGIYCGAHGDPAPYAVHVSESVRSLDISAPTLKLAASMYPLYAKVAKENAEHFETQSLHHLNRLIPWSECPLHLYVHCEQISPVPVLYVRHISAHSAYLDGDTDMDVDDGLPVAHLHIGSQEDPTYAHGTSRQELGPGSPSSHPTAR
ncbi:hypothetical protein C8T65DRAFT_102601 [Cerioporus squamosus]|nr:hypothetical protein C8T65DRAFT_102601 [Cerioporus squamosus]